MLSTRKHAVALIAATARRRSSPAAEAAATTRPPPTPLSLKISEKGQQASFDAPKSATGGLVTVNLANEGKAPHGVEFIQYTGNHTSDDVLKQFGSNSNKTPSWIKLQGGIGSVAGGQTGSADLNLPAGNYVLADAASFGGPSSSGPPATAPLKVSGGTTGALPSTPATVTAATARRTSSSGRSPGSRPEATTSRSTPRARRRST